MRRPLRTHVSYRSIEEGVLAFVPRSERELAQARACVAFQELARTDADIGGVVAELRSQQRELLEHIGREVLDGPGVDALAAVLSYARPLGLPAEQPPFTSAS